MDCIKRKYMTNTFSIYRCVVFLGKEGEVKRKIVVGYTLQQCLTKFYGGV